MRKQPINIYLTVLAFYDNGVLFNAILMLGIPAICKLQLINSFALDVESNNNNNISLSFDDSQDYEHLPLAMDGNQSFIIPYIEFNNTETEDFFCQNPMKFYIRVVYPLALISQTGSIWTTCLITAERYLAVCHPLRAMTLSTRTRATWALVTLSAFAIIYNIPRFFEVQIIGNEVIRSELRLNQVYFWLYYICLHLALLYIIPLTLLSVLNTKIYLTVRKANRDRERLSRSQQIELNLASMLVLLVAIFIACNAPSFIVNCLELLQTSYLQLVAIFSNLLVCINSSINFVIYCIFGKKFRSKLKDTICCKVYARPQRLYSRNMFGASFVGETFV
ncbi:FMRFamide receptor-like protein [Dinothrombium tinctorium]|uniref:FMRFamide receptor-like protein n=1 Tax=Dinothrombium tinctorium TaxID=1965070 RepID=A0A3S3Q883_9ACAR|nr:FMRFamide receptor-like protein [Dinothrombium tinctorium]